MGNQRNGFRGYVQNADIVLAEVKHGSAQIVGYTLEVAKLINVTNNEWRDYSQGYVDGYLNGKRDQLKKDTAKWLDNPTDANGLVKRCSNCGYMYPGYDSATRNEFHFCPICGRWMIGWKTDK